MNAIFKAPEFERITEVRSAIHKAVQGEGPMTQDVAVAKAVIEAYNQEAKEGHSFLKEDPSGVLFRDKGEFDDDSREHNLLSRAMVIVSGSIDTKRLSGEIKASEVATQAFAVSTVMMQMMSVGQMTDAYALGDKSKLNAEQNIILGMGEKDPDMIKDLFHINGGEFSKVSVEMADTMHDVIVAGARKAANQYHLDDLNQKLSHSASVAGDIFKQRNEIEENITTFKNEIDLPSGKDHYPDFKNLDLAVKFATDKENITPEERREFMTGGNIGKFKAVKLLIDAGYEEALRSGLSDRPKLLRDYGHDGRSVRIAAAVMANGAFGDIKSPTLLASMTMNLADTMVKSKHLDFGGDKYIGSGIFSGLNAREKDLLKTDILDFAGFVDNDFVYQLKSMVYKNDPIFDPVQRGAPLENSSNNMMVKLQSNQMQAQAQQGMGM